MQAYQLTLKNYDGTAGTDDLIKWVWALSFDSLRAFMNQNGVLPWLGEFPEILPHSSPDECDVVLGETGDIKKGAKKVKKWAGEVAKSGPDRPRVVIEVYGGVITGVTTDLDMSVTLLDYDNIEAGDEPSAGGCGCTVDRVKVDNVYADVKDYVANV